MPEPEPTLFAVQAAEPRVPADSAARSGAIQTGRSVLVEAPAGSGKTNLLTQRFLALLAEVEEPEQILAITFTRAAAAEMRTRILGALTNARDPAAKHESPELQLARRALAHAEAMGWQLLEQPHRLQIETIDSLCLRLAHAQPLLARLGGQLTPADDAESLYRTAARRTLALLHSGDASSEALRTLLLRRDNSLPELERMLADMLASRAEWMSVRPLASISGEDWVLARAQLEEAFDREHRRVLARLCAEAASMPELSAAWLALARAAAANLDGPSQDVAVHRLRGAVTLPGSSTEDRELWLALSSFLLTKKNEWRKQWNKNDGFPAKADARNPADRERFESRKREMKLCCEQMQAHPRGRALLAALCAVRCLPPLHYSAEQWTAIRAIFTVLRRAVAELRVVFAEANQVDFTEVAQAADRVLCDESTLRGLLESERTRHLLIDEFQDTSRTQFSLVAKLLHEWVEGDGRTAFVVGDPLQSIYGFRQAEVALFHETRDHGLPCGGDRRHRCHPLHLTHNFRSHHALVEELNRRFAAMFEGGESDRFVPSTAWPAPHAEPTYTLHTQFLDKAAGDTAAEARNVEARGIVALLQAELPRIATAEASGADEYRVAVLVRTRAHLRAILPALREAKIPYRAVDLEPLAERPEVYDLLMLLRALLHPAERVAWLSVLRAPWCGLSMADLHLLAGDDDSALLRMPLVEMIDRRMPLLSPDGQQRLVRTWSVLRSALATRYADRNGLSLATWAERTWIALGGAACVTGAALENVEAFLLLLDELAPSGEEVLRGDFAARLASLCARPDPLVSERFGVQVMTMHKAKGLGFATVILPALERRSKADSAALLTMLLRSRRDDPLLSELLLAPISDRDDAETDPAQAWVQAERRARHAEERKRLFYVACTRARTRLHLFATLGVKDAKVEPPKADSLLGAAWAALHDEVEAQFIAVRRSPGTDGVRLAASADEDDAASAENAPAGTAQHVLERIPGSWTPAAWAPDVVVTLPARSSRPLFERAHGASPMQRVRGSALHALLERLTAMLRDAGADSRPSPHPSALAPTAVRILREGGYSLAQARSSAEELTRITIEVLEDPIGRWLLSPRPGALAESIWQSIDGDGALHTLRVDRSFLAGEMPLAPGEHCLWIVDYKTGRPADGKAEETWLAEQQETWSGQLAAYAAAMRHSAAQATAIRCGLYFPELRRLLYWSGAEPEASSA